jgi:hypothetical protein
MRFRIFTEFLGESKISDFADVGALLGNFLEENILAF